MQTIIAVGAAIINNKKVLLIKRSMNQKFFPQYWACPAGKIEETDVSLIHAIIRETKEEVGLTFYPKQKINFYETNLDNYRFLMCLFTGGYEGEIIASEREVEKYGWFSYEEAKKLKLGFRYDQVVEDLHNLKLIH